MRHLLDTTDLSVEEIDEIISLAVDIINNKKKYSKVCEGKKLATLFFEPSTRTRLSFEAAMLELGGSVLGFSEASSSSATKGETVADTTRVVSCYADIIAMRHFIEGAPKVAASNASIPIINAGDGGHSHPTQTMADLLTIFREKGRLDNLTIGLCGDLKFGRTVHSLVKAMCRYSNIKFVLIAPKELAMPDYIKTDYLDKNGMEYIETDKMEALSAGGDDYLVKPFSYVELIARIQALIRRCRVYDNADASDTTASSTIERCGLTLYTKCNNVSYDGRQLALTDKEYQILLLLISHPTKTFSTQNIFESVWNEPYTQFSNNTIMVHIKNLRNKLEAGCGCAHLIKTVWGKGYKFEE